MKRKESIKQSRKEKRETGTIQEEQAGESKTDRQREGTAES